MHRKKCGGCNCGKNNQYKSKHPLRKSVDKLKNPLTMMQSFAMSLASRGLTNKKADIPTKQLRTLSCFGDESIGGSLPPCEGLGKSETGGRFYCTECGCGDREGTWLNSTNENYSKLDYPKLHCPRKMPGFSNYLMSETKDNSRKYIIENYNAAQLVKITVSSPDIPEDKKPII